MSACIAADCMLFFSESFIGIVGGSRTSRVVITQV